MLNRQEMWSSKTGQTYLSRYYAIKRKRQEQKRKSNT